MVADKSNSDRKAKICFVAPNIWPVLSGERSIQFAGGAEFRQSILARALVRDGFSVSAISLDYGQPKVTEVDGITIFSAHKPEGGLPIVRFIHPRLTSWWSAMKLADSEIYFQSCASYLTGVTAVYSRTYRRKFIYSGASDPDFNRALTKKLFTGRGGWRDFQMYKLGLRLSDGIVAQHKGQVVDLKKWYGREAIEIPNCYELPSASCISRGGTVLWVSTVKSLKRPDYYLNLARRLPNLRFRMIGGAGIGKEKELFNKIRKEAAGVPNVEFIGFVPVAEVEKYFNDARVFVNTSEFEGFPNTFLQAWARGIPTVSFVDCLASDNGKPIGSVCRDIDEMVQKTFQLMTDNLLWEAEGDRIRQYFRKHHSVGMALNRYSQLFERMLSPNVGGVRGNAS